MEGFKFGSGRKKPSGVAKNGKNESRVIIFFRIYWRKFWRMIGLNALYLIMCIPIVTIGPATSALMKISRNYSQERSTFMFSDFFTAFKSNFKQSFIVGLIDLGLIGIVSSALYYYFTLAKEKTSFTALMIIMGSVAFVIVSMQFYIFLMIVSTNLKISEIIKNSLILSIVELKTNLITFVIVAIIVAFNVLFFPFSMILIPLFPFALIGLIVAFNCYPIIRKHIIQPYYDQKGELNPEYEYLVGSDDDIKTTFKDSVGINDK